MRIKVCTGSVSQLCAVWYEHMQTSLSLKKQQQSSATYMNFKE